MWVRVYDLRTNRFPSRDPVVLDGRVPVLGGFSNGGRYPSAQRARKSCTYPTSTSPWTTWLVVRPLQDPRPPGSHRSGKVVLLLMTTTQSSSSALVLFSGGQDSTTCLAWALSRYAHVETVGFDYGQRHAVELECRSRLFTAFRARSREWAERLGNDHLIDLKVLGQLSETALTRVTEIELDTQGLPNTFVPGRNLLFFSFAATVAWRRGIKALVGGMCEEEYSGYPDCRDDTLKALQVALNLGMDSHFVIETPLMWIDKAETWRLAESLGGTELVELIRRETHTCYIGERGTLHEWGHGCGRCPACELRAKGWAEYCA
jgi:7-cyano-7-deazaguanine synthase